jgi:hypothetical protein
MITTLAPHVPTPTEPSNIDLDLVHDPDEMRLRLGRAVELPDPTAVCCAVAHAAVEALHGARPVQQLARLVSPQVYEQLAQRARVQQEVDRVNGVTPRAKVGNADATRTRPRASTRIVTARVLRVSPIAAEASIVLQDGPRARAAALRVEEFRGRWRVSALQIG